MGRDKSVESALNLSGSISEGQQRDDGYWVDNEGKPLPVSASDLERHTYCPLSWQLSKAGISGEGEALEKGMIAHDKIHDKMQDFKTSEDKASREIIIWSWWFTVVCALSADSAAFFFVNEGVIPESFIKDIGKFLVILAGVWLLLAIILISLPWRQWLGRPFGLAQPPHIEGTGLKSQNIESPFDLKGKGGFGEGGNLEARVLLASIAVALHGLAIYSAENRTLVTFSLIVATLAWLLISAWQLQKVLITDQKVVGARKGIGLKDGEELAYSDDSGESAVLLVDENTGVRGRPDQIIKINNQYIPVEQKTGKIPREPHDSHKMQLLAYIHLVGETTGSIPDYGVLRYGEDSLFTVPWTDLTRADLAYAIQEVQRLMVQGGAERNHQRVGKCKNCSRQKQCPQSLV